MIFVKTGEEIELLRESNRLVGMTLGEMAKHIRPGDFYIKAPIVLQRSLFVTTVQSPDFWVTVVFRIRFVFL